MTTLHVALGELTKIVLKVIIVCNIIFGVSNDENVLVIENFRHNGFSQVDLVLSYVFSCSIFINELIMKSLNIDGQQFHKYFSAQIIEDKKKDHGM